MPRQSKRNNIVRKWLVLKRKNAVLNKSKPAKKRKKRVLQNKKPKQNKAAKPHRRPNRLRLAEGLPP